MRRLVVSTKSSEPRQRSHPSPDRKGGVALAPHGRFAIASLVGSRRGGANQPMRLWRNDRAVPKQPLPYGRGSDDFVVGARMTSLRLRDVASEPRPLGSGL